MTFTTLEARILKISGASLGPGSSIAAGTTFTKSRLTTIDEDRGPVGPLDLHYDPYVVFSNEPGVTQVRIDGIDAGNTLAVYRTLVTATGGTFEALVINFNGDSYLLPQAGTKIGKIGDIISSTPLPATPGTSISVAEWGLVPEAANRFTGELYVENNFGTTLSSNEVVEITVYDTDVVRGSADSVAEEIGYGNSAAVGGQRPRVFAAGEAEEVQATVLFEDGSVGTVAAIRQGYAQPYGASTEQYLFSADDLARLGQTVGSVAKVTAFYQIDHQLDWEELGLTLTREGHGPVTDDPVPGPRYTEIAGTTRNDVLIGDEANNALFGGAGRDRLTGGDGVDAFVFRSEASNGVREIDTVTDYQVGQDFIAFGDGATVTNVRNIAGGVQIQFAGDNDVLRVLGAGVDTFSVRIFSDAYLDFLL